MTESTSEYWMTTVDDEVHKVNEVLTSSAKAGWELVTATASQWGETDGRGAVTEHTTYAIDDGQTALVLVGESKIEAPSRTQASSPASRVQAP